MDKKDISEIIKMLEQKYAIVSQYQLRERVELICADLAKIQDITIEEAFEIYSRSCEERRQQTSRFAQF
jgi:hypothetical protein